MKRGKEGGGGVACLDGFYERLSRYASVRQKLSKSIQPFNVTFRRSLPFNPWSNSRSLRFQSLVSRKGTELDLNV